MSDVGSMRTYGILCCTGRIHKNLLLLVKNIHHYKVKEWQISVNGILQI